MSVMNIGTLKGIVPNPRRTTRRERKEMKPMLPKKWKNQKEEIKDGGSESSLL